MTVHKKIHPILSILVSLLLALSAFLPLHCLAFTVPSRSSTTKSSPFLYIKKSIPQPPQSCDSRSTNTLLRMAPIPEIDQWEVKKTGEVLGIARKHPVVEDGDNIETSALKTPSLAAEGKIVVTKSGSKYKLLKAKATTTNNKTSAASSSTAPNLKKQLASLPPSKKPNGKTVGPNAKYLLVGKPMRTTSGKSQIWTAYLSSDAGLPTGPRLKIKMSPNRDALGRESKNYDKITTGFFYGKFVKKVEYLSRASPEGGEFQNVAALVIEAGEGDLRDVLRANRGLEGKALRDVAAAVAQCIQAVHASGLVWTDLKTENFILGTMGSTDTVRGVDLESAIREGGNPVTYSPEAAPPEFAVALGVGKGEEFVLDKSYDIWSLGVMLYEVSTGMPYFKGKTPTSLLRNPDFVADLRAVKDEKMRDLIGQCMNVDPAKRPSITRLLLHPFFTTTGIGPFGF